MAALPSLSQLQVRRLFFPLSTHNTPVARSLWTSSFWRTYVLTFVADYTFIFGMYRCVFFGYFSTCRMFVSVCLCLFLFVIVLRRGEFGTDGNAHPVSYANVYHLLPVGIENFKLGRLCYCSVTKKRYRYSSKNVLE